MSAIPRHSAREGRKKTEFIALRGCASQKDAPP